MTTENMKQIAAVAPPANDNPIAVFGTTAGFEAGQRIAKALASSTMVPEAYRGNIGNCLIAMEMANRTGSSVMAVMQNVHIIHGRPSWSSQYVIAALNSCGRFAPLRFNVFGEGDEKTCIAWTTDASGERLEGPPVSIKMAKAEGWFSKNGSKWQTMPDLMLRYRAAKFFGNLYAPDVLMGMHTDDEVIDIAPARDITPAPVAAVVSATESTAETVTAKRRRELPRRDNPVQPVESEHVTDAEFTDVAEAPPAADGEDLF